MAQRDFRRQGERRLLLGDRSAPAQRGFRRRRVRPGTARAAPRRGGGDRRRHRQRQGRARGGGDRGARLPRRVLRPARDHGGAARRRPILECAQWLDPFPGPARRRAGRHGLHLHRAGAARPHRACAACRRHPRLPAERRPPDAASPPTMCARRHRAVAHPHPRARASRPELRLDYASQPVALHDRFLLCSDGVHGIADGREHRRHPARALRAGGYRRALVAAALEAGSTDNCTALVLDVVACRPRTRPISARPSRSCR